MRPIGQTRVMHQADYFQKRMVHPHIWMISFYPLLCFSYVYGNGIYETMSKVSRGQIYPSFGPSPLLFHPFGQIVGIEQSLISQPEFCSSTTLILGFWGLLGPGFLFLFIRRIFQFFFCNLLFPLFICIWREVAGQRFCALLCIVFSSFLL